MPVGQQPPREVEAEEARAAGDRPSHRGRTLRARREPGPLVAGRALALAAALLAGLTLAAAAHAGNPQIAGLQVALRAYGLYNGPVDAIAGPKTVRATKAFQRRAGLVADGRAGPATRRALGPLGTPVFGRRTLRRGVFGWDVSVLQFMLARRGELVPVYGFFDRRHRARAAPLPAREAARGRRHRRAGHAEDARARHSRRAAGPPRAHRPDGERAHDADQLGDRLPPRPGARPGARLDGVGLPAGARLVGRRARACCRCCRPRARTSSRC